MEWIKHLQFVEVDMDNLRNWDGGMDGMPDYESFEEEPEAAIEPPPAIGNDERRMHVRAYNFWASLLGERKYPDIEDLDPEHNDDFGPKSVLLDFTEGMEDPGIAFLGEQLRACAEIEDKIERLNDVPPRSLLSRITDHYLQIIANEAPIGFEAEFVNRQGVTILYRGILLPFSSDDDNIDFIYGVINWKEAAPSEEQAALEAEMAQAIQTAPRPAEIGSAWADGPTSSPLLDKNPLSREPTEATSPATDLTRPDLYQEVEATPSLHERMMGLLAKDKKGVEPVQQGIISALEAQPDENAALADWLAVARSSVEHALDCEKRSRAALYGAIGRAYDFYLMTLAQPQEYEDILADAGITVQDRAPMTPVVKLVFGQDYDKTRLAEFAAALRFADSAGMERGTFADFLSGYEGGLKALVQAERAQRNDDIVAVAPAAASEDPRIQLRMAPARSLEELDAGDEEFVLLVARRNDAGALELVAPVRGDAKLTEKALRKAAV